MAPDETDETDEQRERRISEMQGRAGEEHRYGSSLGAGAAPNYGSVRQGRASGTIVAGSLDFDPACHPSAMSHLLGLRALSDEEFDRLCRARALAEVVGKFISELEARLDGDKRWLAIAKTDLQKGFDALKRSIVRPDGF